MHLSTDGIIIKETIARENDKYIVALTRHAGLITAYARGARRIKSKNATASGLLCYADLTFYKGKDTYQLDEASAREVFFDLRSDIVKLSLAQYFCELALCLAPEGGEAEEFLRLMLNALHYLCKGTRDMYCVKAIVELRMLCLAGYMPDLTACCACQRDEADILYFDVRGGVLYCADCKPQTAGLIPLNRTVLAAMRHIAYSEFDRLFRFTLPEATAKELTRATERFLLHQVERGFNTLDFYHTL